jgi:hypothetical protein
MIKTLSKIEIVRNFFNLRKTIYKKPTVNIILNGKKFEGLSPKSGTSQEYLILSYLSNTFLEVLVHKARKGNKEHTN